MILKLQPVYFDKVWGGDDFHRLYHYQTGSHCGEAWGISTHPHGSSVIENSIYQGLTLSQLFDNHKELFGGYNEPSFPILVKIISAKEPLSVQVHPNNQQAAKHHSLGKEECWLVLDCKPNAEILIGHHATTKTQWQEAIESDNVESLLNKYPIKKGDFFYIKAGTVHAICEETVILEVQQSSDITYRLYDYNRLHNGTLRELHINEALDAMTIPDDTLLREPQNTLFQYDVVTVQQKESYQASIHGDYIFMIDGQGTFNDINVSKGDFLMVSSLDRYTVSGSISFQRTRF